MKKPLLITTLAAGALLVGGTFAAYVITDNAAQKDVHIGIGNLIIDEDEPITLEWGEGTVIGDVEDLQPGAAKSVGKVVVKAVAEDTELVYDGRLDLQFEFEEGSKLDKYLTYHVYADNGGEIGEEIQAGSDGMFAVQGDAAGRTYHITVALGQPTDEDRIAISEDEATLYIDWKAAPAVKYVISHGIGEEWADMDLEITELSNEEIAQGLKKQYHVEIDLAEGERFVFHLDETWVHPTDENFVNEVGEIIGSEGNDFKALGAGSYDMYLKDWGNHFAIWAEFTPENQDPEPPVAHVYSIEKGGVALNMAATSDAQNLAIYAGVELEANDVIVIKEDGVAQDFYHWDEQEKKAVKDGDSYIVSETGTYNFYFNKNREIYAEKVVEVQAMTITVNGAPDWLTNDGCVVFAWAWGGQEPNTWYECEYGEGEKPTSFSFVVPGDRTGCLLVRCAEGTQTPSWSETGTGAGRIFNQSGDITFVENQVEYVCPAFVEYSGS